MEKTLETFGKLPPGQRLQCIRAFTEFAGMSAQEKQDFLKNAQRWSQMSPKERQTWRDLVTHVPEWPPLPSGSADATGAAAPDAARAARPWPPPITIERAANFNSHFRRRTLISRRASDCVSTRLVPDSLVWRDDRAGVPGGALDGHPPRPARKHLRRKNRRPRVLDHARRDGWRPHRLCDDLLENEFAHQPFSEIFMIQHGGLVYYGSLIGAALAFIIYVRWKKLSGWKIADILAPSIALGNAFGRIGCLLNGCCYGRVCHPALGHPLSQPIRRLAATLPSGTGGKG
jgi:hypothetical protein